MDRNNPEYKKAVKEVRADPKSKFCFVSGEFIEPGAGDCHHVLPVAQFEAFSCQPRNIVIVSRAAHNVLTSGTAEEIRSLPRIHNLMARIRELSLAYYIITKDRIYGESNKMDGIY